VAVNITRASLEDVAELVAVHQEAFPDFFLTLLGPRFLRRFYAAVVRHPKALGFIARRDRHAIGFVVGPTEPAGFFRALLLQEGVGFCLDAIPALLRHPVFVARRLWRGATYRGEAPAMPGKSALVSSIAVLPSASGAGVGAELLGAFCDAAAERCVDSVYLVTDRDYNPGANAFYRKAGFVLDCELPRSDGRTMNRYVRTLSRSDS
jgi:ribosomal protein S18 acetylase RimI-like enzyme